MYRRSVCLLSRGVCLGSLLWASLAVTPAGAETVTYNFAGMVTNVATAPNVQGSPFQIDQAMSGQMTVSDVMVSGTYTIQSLTMKIGTSYQATGIGTGSVSIVNSGVDRFYASKFVSGNVVNGYTPSYFSIDLQGSGSLFDSTALPSTVPSISDAFTVKNEWKLVFSGGKTVIGKMSQLTAVPLPAAVLLFGTGLVALVGLGAGSRSLRASKFVS